jgi:hypothetical protein
MKRLRFTGVAWLVVLTAAVMAAFAVPVQEEWRLARAREMYLPDLEAIARQSPYDGFRPDSSCPPLARWNVRWARARIRPLSG